MIVCAPIGTLIFSLTFVRNSYHLLRNSRSHVHTLLRHPRPQSQQEIPPQWNAGKISQPLRDAIVNSIKAPFDRASPSEQLWVLKDLSFDVDPEQAVGIIGRNVTRVDGTGPLSIEG